MAPNKLNLNPKLDVNIFQGMVICACSYAFFFLSSLFAQKNKTCKQAIMAH
jgi:hypothetical protein